jgi:hypothetical protein
MSKNRKGKSAGYKPVECQDLQHEINGENIPSPISRPVNPYTIVGACRVSRSGLSLSIKLFGDTHRFLTIGKQDIINLFTDTNGLSVASVKEYHNVEPIEQNPIIVCK